MSAHEVYVNPPVALVALEIRHPLSDQLAPPELRAIRERIRRHVPITRSSQTVNSVVVPDGQPSTKIERFPRLVNRANTLAVSFRQEAILIETSFYPGWDDFKIVVADTVRARIEEAPIEGIERVGIRYINELRPDPTPLDRGIDWAQWVQPQLLGPPSPTPSLPLARWQGLGLYGQQPGHMMIFRYGPMDAGFSLNPQFELRRRRPTAGPFFLIDIDSFRLPEAEIPEADPDRLLQICEDLHEPVSVIFESSITDNLREVFRQDAE